VVDEVRVLQLLRSVTDDLAVLRHEASSDERRRADPLWLRGVKYTFVTAIEGCVDVAQHICASEGWGPPRDNGDALEVLGRHRVLTSPGPRQAASGGPGSGRPGRPRWRTGPQRLLEPVKVGQQHPNEGFGINLSPRNSTTLGSRSLLRARSSPKSVSAERNTPVGC